MGITDYYSEEIYRYVSKKLSDLEQKMLHCWEVKLLDDIKNCQLPSNKLNGS